VGEQSKTYEIAHGLGEMLAEGYSALRHFSRSASAGTVTIACDPHTGAPRLMSAMAWSGPLLARRGLFALRAGRTPFDDRPPQSPPAPSPH
jgi:hypothetical protein